MGTNYYAKKHYYGYWGDYVEKYHIGKSSAGWKFLFNHVKNETHSLYTGDDWDKFLDDFSVEIEDECGRKVKLLNFWVMVHNKQDSEAHNDPMYCGLDEEGYNVMNKPNVEWS